MIYLDSAATSFLKPPAVAKAVAEAVRTCASPGRGVYPAAMRGADTVYSCREEAAALFGMDSCENVVFTMNATHALNIAIHSLVRPGIRVLISGYEHNAVLRPLVNAGADIVTAAGEPFNADSFMEDFRKRLPESEAVVCTHVSNVFGFRIPVEDIGALCTERGIPFILDAAQSAGHISLDFPLSGAQFAAMPGHKGLMGPQGTGLLLCRGTADPFMFGGTGNQSRSVRMPEELPERLEAGTQNVCGIAGLREGLRFIRKTGVDRIAERERILAANLADGLSKIRGLKVICVPKENRTGVISVIPEGMSCEDMAFSLGRAGVAVRAGLHCAPLAHKTAGTDATGTVRFSVSALNTHDEIDAAVGITENIIKNNYKL